jgi:CDP-diacylglycerol--glycerol-3-phosphate 3-phosphatidyltransferase
MPAPPWNVPNQLSLSRLILCALMAGVLSIPFQAKAPIALLIFIIASITDWLDGYLARRNHQITALGKLLDPLADKILICTAFIGLLQEGLIALWMVALIMAREFLVTGLRLVAAAQGTVLAAEKLGKHKMVTQVSSIIFGYGILTFHTYWIQEHPFTRWLYHCYQLLLIITVGISLLSGLIYFYKNRHVLHADILKKDQPGTLTPTTPASAPAFKEWSGIVDLLASGKQILILRKGGIHEGRGGFNLKHSKFWLFPTHFHEQARFLRNITPQTPDDQEKQIRITAYAEVTDAYFIYNSQLISKLAPFHYWEEKVITERFTQEEPYGLHLFILKVHCLTQSISLPMIPAYGGCRSWVTLPIDWKNETTIPALDEATFQSRRNEILKLLTPDVAEKLSLRDS